MNRPTVVSSVEWVQTDRPASPEVTGQFLHLGARQGLRYHRRKLTDALALALAEGVALLAALGLANRLDLWLTGTTLWPGWIWSLPLLWWGVAAVSRLLPGWGLGAAEELRRTTVGLLAIFGGTTALLFLLQWPTGNGRLLLSLGCTLALIMVPLARTLTKRILIRLGRWGVPAVIYGAGPELADVVAALRNEAGLGYRPVGIFHADAACRGLRIADVPVLGGLEHNTPDAPVAVLVLSGFDRRQLPALLDGPLGLYKQVVLISDLSDIPSLWVRPCNFSERLAFEIASNLSDPFARLLKRALDLVLVLGSMPIWLPLIGLLALIVWLEDRHAPFFTQERIGRGGRPFRVIKLRTMKPEAEAVLQRYLAEHPEARAEWARCFKLKNDPRITRVGRWLRKFSLDELPQLFNVLKGEMSLVGPRPLPVYHHDELPHLVQQLRARVRPGMTGLWQVSGRSDAGHEGMVRWDAFYIRNWSLWLDLVVLIRTLRAVLKGEGAY